MALEVEAAAVAAARERQPGFTRPSPSPADVAGQAVAGAGPPETVRLWGSLPAPWEPFPEELFGGGPSSPGEAPALGAPADSAAATAVPAMAGPGAGPGAAPAAVFRAGAERSVPEGGGAGVAGEATPQGPGGGKVDLDSLARQVYTILRRRLAGERRRNL